MTDPAKAVKGAFTKKTGKNAALIGLGIGAAEFGDYLIKKVGKTDKVPDGVSGLFVAGIAAAFKQPAISIGGLVDTGVVTVRTLTGYDVTKPAEGVNNMSKNNSDEKVY